MNAERGSIDAVCARLVELGKSSEAITNPETAILVERDEKEAHIATLTINRPHAKNALDTISWRTLGLRLEELGRDEAVRAVVIRGAGGDFCAGADINEIARFADALEGRPMEVSQAAYDYFQVARETMRIMDNSPFVIIARMEGNTLGIGNILALACDRRIADKTVRTGVPAGLLGIMLDPRELWRLVVHLGEGNAKNIINSGEVFDWDRSRRMGQFDTLVETDKDLDAAIKEAARRAARQSKGAIVTAKRGFHLINGTPGFNDGDITLEEHYSWADKEAVERIKAFQRRRTA